jgi:hypothetical protein
MPRESVVYEVLIASPSDVVTERKILSEVVEDWNSANSRSRGISLRAIRWELDSVPAVGQRAQEIINKQLVETADFLMAVFSVRLGTPTGKAASGTVEEIEHFRDRRKPILLYFSEGPIPRGHDAEQFRLLREFKKTIQPYALYGTFENPEELRRLASRHLTRIVDELAGGLAAASKPPVTANKGQLARVLFQTRVGGWIPGTNIRVVTVFGSIRNLSQSGRISEYSCTLSVPKCCLTYQSAIYPAEVPSQDTNYRSFRHTEATHSRVAIHSGDTFQIISVEIAVGHLSGDEQRRCLEMEIIADAVADGELLQVRKVVAELME